MSFLHLLYLIVSFVCFYWHACLFHSLLPPFSLSPFLFLGGWHINVIFLSLSFTPSINIPYIKGISKNINCICIRYNIWVTFSSSNTLKSLSIHFKNCVYSISCTCGMTYTGETKRTLTVRIEEHKKPVTKGETHKSKLAENIWNANSDHIPLWNNIKWALLEREEIKRSSPCPLVPQVYEPHQCGSQPGVAPAVNETKQLKSWLDKFTWRRPKSISSETSYFYN